MFKRINDEFSPSANTLKWMNRCRMKKMTLGAMNREGLRTEQAPYGYPIDFMFTILVLILGSISDIGRCNSQIFKKRETIYS
jgi:hypothetical protein